MNARPEPEAGRGPGEAGRVELDAVRALLAGVVGDRSRVDALDADASLFDALPELDSIACVNLVLAMEARYGFEVDDEDVDEALFASLESLRAYVEGRLARTP